MGRTCCAMVAAVGVLGYDTWARCTEEDGVLGEIVYELCATRVGTVYAGTELGGSAFLGIGDE